MSEPARARRVDVGHLSLNTALDGKEGAPWLVLSNSLGGNLAMWDGEVAWLAERWRVLRYDTRGHGGSDVPIGPYRFDDLIRDVLALMDRFAIERAAFMGLSMGGMTGLGLSLRSPQRIARLVVADARADAPPPFRAMWDERIAKVREGGLEAVAPGTVESWLSEATRRREPALTDRIKSMVTANSAAGYVACCQAIQQLDYLKDLGALEAPTLYVGGELDKGAPVEAMAAMAEATPNALHRVVAAAAHLANLDNPAGFRAAVEAFLTP